MSTEHFDTIKKEIKDSGIPLEIYSSIILDQLGWFVKRNCLYNPPEGTYREIDVIGEKESFIPTINNLLILECKKSRKPWVFFRQGNKISEDPFMITFVSKNDSATYECLKNVIKKFHYFGSDIHTYFIAPDFKEERKKGDEQTYDPIFKAIKQLLNGVAFVFDQNHNFLVKKPLNVNAFFLYPIIVFDGQLLSSEVNLDGEISLEERNHISLILNLEIEDPHIVKFRLKSRGLKSKRIIIDVVKKEYLKEFLTKSFN